MSRAWAGRGRGGPGLRGGARSAPRWLPSQAEERGCGVRLTTALASVAVDGSLELPRGAERPRLAFVRVQILHVPRSGRGGVGGWAQLIKPHTRTRTLGGGPPSPQPPAPAPRSHRSPAPGLTGCVE